MSKQLEEPDLRCNESFDAKRKRNHLTVDTKLANTEYVAGMSVRERIRPKVTETPLVVQQQRIEKNKENVIQTIVYQDCLSCNGEGHVPVKLVSHIREDGKRHFFSSPVSKQHSLEGHQAALEHQYHNHPMFYNRPSLVMCCCGVPSHHQVDYIPKEKAIEMVTRTIQTKRMIDRDRREVAGLELFLRALS